MSKINKKIRSLRYDFTKSELYEKNVDKNPFLQFEKWFEEAMESEQPDTNAFTLATSSAEGVPSARILLLRGFSQAGFEFYTNYHSRKANDIENNPNGCILFFWNKLQRQVRIEGKIEKITGAASDEYFKSRPKDSRIGAWASTQSKVIPSRLYLEEQAKKFTEQYLTEVFNQPQILSLQDQRIRSIQSF